MDYLAMPFLEQPWTRVAAVLAVFSILYFTVNVLKEESLRQEFFAGADEGVKQRLAVGIAYQRRVEAWERRAGRR